MSKFWGLLEDSVIVQALVTLSLVGAVVFLVVSGKDVPDALLNLCLITLGYYFGSKAQLTGKQAARTIIQEMENGRSSAVKD